MYNPEIIRAMESAEKNGHFTARALHDVFGIDYNKPFFGQIINGHFTARQVLTAIRAAGIDTANAVNIILTRPTTGNHWRRGEWQAVTIDDAGRVDIEHKDNNRSGNTTRKRAGFEYYFRKSDFEDDRKSGTAAAIVISQEAQHLHKPAEKTLDPDERYKVIDFNRCKCANTNDTYISRITLQRTTDAGTTAEIGNPSSPRVIYRGYFEPATVEDAIDKSGYLVYDRRREWKRRARALRADRDRVAANTVDYSGHIAELERLFKERKKTIAAALEAAQAPHELKKVNTMIDDYKTGLYLTALDMERWKEAAEKKNFTSPEKARAAFESIRAKLDPQPRQEAAEEVKTA